MLRSREKKNIGEEEKPKERGKVGGGGWGVGGDGVEREKYERTKRNGASIYLVEHSKTSSTLGVESKSTHVGASLVIRVNVNEVVNGMMMGMGIV